MCIRDRPGDVVFLHPVDIGQQPFIPREELAAVVAERIEGPAFDQAFHSPLVQILAVHPLAEIGEAFKGAGLPFLEHLPNQAPANVFHRQKAEARCV